MNSSVDRSIMEIVAAFNAGDHETAMRLCKKAVRRNPRHAALNHLYASIGFSRQDYSLALSAAETSLKTRPESIKTRILAGRAARALGRIETAEEHFTKLVPAVPEFAIELARMLDQDGDRLRAKEAWSRVRQTDPSSREAAARLGRLLWEEGKCVEAREHLELAVKGDTPASAWFDLGLVRQDCGDVSGAAEAFGTALSLRPDDAEAAFNLGAALQELGDLEGAISSYRNAYAISGSTLGMIANVLTSASNGLMFARKSQLVDFLTR